MHLPELPSDIISVIAQKLGQLTLWRLGTILQTGRIGRDVVYSYEVLKDLSINDLVADIDNILLDGANRRLFCKMSRRRNPTTIYYEATVLMTKQQDISAAIEFLERLVPLSANAIYLCGMLCVCVGRTERIAQLLELCVDVHAECDFDKLTRLGEGVMDTVIAFYPPMNNSFASTWHYPDYHVLSFPNCAIEHEF